MAIESTSEASGRTKYIRPLETGAVLLLPESTRIAGFGSETSSPIARFHSRVGTAIGRQERLLLLRTTK
jgi:hypothetical protein